MSLQRAFSFTYLEFAQWNNSLWGKNSSWKEKMLSPRCCRCSSLPTCWDVVFFCDNFVFNIQWRISRWKRDQSPTLLNICSISQLSEPNQTTQKIIQENRLSNDQIKPMINRNNEAKSTFFSKSHWGSLKSQSSDIWYKLQIKLYEITVFALILIIFSCLFILICGKHGLNSFNSLC